MKINEVTMRRIGEIIAEKNSELAELGITLTAENDSAGVYIHAGRTPVYVTAKVGKPFDLLDRIRFQVDEFIASSRVAAERRARIATDAASVKNEGEQLSKAIETLKAAGLDTSLLSGGCDKAATEKIVAAVKAAVKAANVNPPIDVLRYRDFRLNTRTYPAGIVIVAGGEPVMVTRFPKVSAPEVIEKACGFVRAEIAALNESRRSQFAAHNRELEKENKLREIAAQRDREEVYMAAAM